MSPISIKGKRGGLMIRIAPQCNFEDIRQDLIQKLDSARGFFNGAKFNLSGHGNLENEQRETLENICIERGMVSDNTIVSKPSPIKKAKKVRTTETSEGNIVLKSTIRSGQRVLSKKDLVIIGNVNPGAELIAEGNIIVMGSLKGTAHAGVLGDNRATVMAQEMLPSQIRIGNLVAYKPDHDGIKRNNPEIAYVTDDKIVVDEYRGKQGKTVIA